MYISQVQLGLPPHIGICIEGALDATTEGSSVHDVVYRNCLLARLQRKAESSLVWWGYGSNLWEKHLSQEVQFRVAVGGDFAMTLGASN